jgi:putative transposase
MKNIYQSKKPENLLELQLRHCVNGLKKIRSVSLTVQPDEKCIINKTFLTLLISLSYRFSQKKEKLLTAEYLQKNKKMTLTDRKNFSSVNTLSMTWLLILDQESIGIVKDFKPFWNNQCLEMSQKLWLPTEIDSVDLLSNSLNLYLPSVKSNSLFSVVHKVNQAQSIMNYQKILCPSSMSTVADKWVNVDTQTNLNLKHPINPQLKTRKLRIYPNANQKKILKEWINVTRYVYNKGVAEIDKVGNQSINFYDLRNKFVTAKGNDLTEWELNVPKDIRAGGLRDLTKAYKTVFSQIKSGQIRKFKVGFRSKKSGSQSIEIPKTSIKLTDRQSTSCFFEIFKTYGLGTLKICKRDHIPEIKYDTRLQLDKDNKWYINIPFEYKIKPNKVNGSICALDPGIRKFQVIYSPKEVIKVTTNYDLLRKLKDKISIFAKLRSAKTISNQRYKRKIIKMWSRHRNLINDQHYQLANYLVNNYSKIYIPKFESQKLTKKLGRTCNFNMLNLQHYQFRERLKFKCIEYGSKFMICTEEYTSKTCGRCGILNEVGSSETFKCSSCKLIIDRDINGSRNIYLKHESKK